MCVCLECGVKHNPVKLPTKYGLIGWIDTCQLCGELTKVYANDQFGVNPKVSKSTSHREMPSTELGRD
jgi:hypothetical protein